MDESSTTLLIEQFKAVTDISSDDNDEDISNLLRVHDYNMNNAISTYFDSGFTSVSGSNRNEVRDSRESSDTSVSVNEYSPAVDADVILPSTSGIASGASFHDIEDNTSRQRRPSFQTVNLQHQLYYDSFMPKLPKAPKLSNHWQLGLSLYNSRKQAEQVLEKSQEKEGEEDVDAKLLEVETISSTPSESNDINGGVRKSRPLWLLFLIIPQGFINALVSIAQFFLSPFFSSSLPLKRHRIIPKLFNYDHLQMDFIPKLSPSIKELAKTNLHIVDKHFNETFDKAMKEYKWLLVILLTPDDENPEEELETSFIDKFLLNSRVQTVFSKENSSIFIGSVNGSPECLELAQTYQVKRLPYVMLVANINNIPSIVYKCNLAPIFVTPGALPTTIDKIIRNILKQVEIYTPQLISDKFESQEMEQSRQIRQSQDDAYLQSLERDRQRKLERENSQWLKSLKTSFLKYHICLGEEEEYEDTPIRCAIKLPNGKRLLSRFSPLLTITQLYFHIEKHLYIAQLLEDGDFESEAEIHEKLALENLQPPSHKDGSEFTLEDYQTKFPWNFEVVQPYPKVVIASSKKKLSEVKELKSGANLLVEYTDDDTDDVDNEESNE